MHMAPHQAIYNPFQGGAYLQHYQLRFVPQTAADAPAAPVHPEPEATWGEEPDVDANLGDELVEEDTWGEVEPDIAWEEEPETTWEEEPDTTWG